MKRLLCWLAIALCLPTLALAMPFRGAQTSSAPQTPPKALKPGEFVWHPGIAPAGPIVVNVNLDDQLAFVYRNGVEIGRAKLHVTDPMKPLGAHAFIVAQLVYPLFVPGTTLVVLDAPVLAQNTGFEMTVLANGAPTTGAP